MQQLSLEICLNASLLNSPPLHFAVLRCQSVDASTSRQPDRVAKWMQGVTALSWAGKFFKLINYIFVEKLAFFKKIELKEIGGKKFYSILRFIGFCKKEVIENRSNHNLVESEHYHREIFF